MALAKSFTLSLDERHVFPIWFGEEIARYAGATKNLPFQTGHEFK